MMKKKSPANWFIKMRVSQRGDAGEKLPFSFSPDRLNMQLAWDKGVVFCHAKMRYIERAGFLWPVFRLQLRGTKA